MTRDPRTMTFLEWHGEVGCNAYCQDGLHADIIWNSSPVHIEREPEALRNAVQKVIDMVWDGVRVVRAQPAPEAPSDPHLHWNVNAKALVPPNPNERAYLMIVKVEDAE